MITNPPEEKQQQFPFTVPTIASLERMQFTSRVAFFVGENGTGKSTLLEAIALAAGLAYEGGSRNFNASQRAAFLGQSQAALIGELADTLTLRWRKRPRDAYFLRAESFYNVVTYLEDLDDPRAFASYGGVSLHKRSHGESFLTMMVERFSGGGLYLIDEPEAALSAARQLAFLARMHVLLDEGDTQFIVASHSPIILAFPHAQLFSFEHSPPREIKYRETDAYRITRRFLDNPDRGVAEVFDS